MGLDCWGEPEILLLEGTQKVWHMPEPRARAVTSKRPGPDLPASLGGSPGEAGGGYASLGS